MLPVTLYVTVSSNTVTLFGNTFLPKRVKLGCKLLKTLHFYLTTNSGMGFATVLVPVGISPPVTCKGNDHMKKQNANATWIKIDRNTMNAADKARHDEVVKARRALVEAEEAFKQGFTKRIARHVPDGQKVVYSFRFDTPAFAFVADEGRPAKDFPFDLDAEEVESARKALGAPKGRGRAK